MKNMNKKGQGAMEYLMTYGWAILVVLIVGIVLWQLGIFSGITGGGNRATGFNVVVPIDKTIYITPINMTFVLENRAGNAITITELNASGSCTGYSASNIHIADALYNGTYVMKTGKSAIVEFTSCTGSAGDTVSVDVDISYTERVAGQTQTHEEAGTIRAKIEP